MNNKKAQFFLIAAIIISFIIIGVAGTKNYLQVSEEPISLSEKGNEINLEGSWVIDQGIYTGSEDSVIEDKLLMFSQEFSEYLAETGETFELVIIYGDNQGAIKKTYTRDESGYVGAGDFQTVNYNIEESPITRYPSDSITTLESEYNVKLKDNENFFFVITTSKGFENYVYGNI